MPSKRRTILRHGLAAGKEKSSRVEPADKKKGTWNKHSLRVINAVVARVRKHIYFEKGTHELQGEWPLALAQSCILDPASDPVKFRKIFPLVKESAVNVAPGEDLADAPDDSTASVADARPVSREDFAVPKILIWAPEFMFPDFYPQQRPNCPFHGKASCVLHHGKIGYVRRCYGSDSNIALVHFRYKCKLRVAEGNKSSTFFGADRKVIEKAPAYVRAQWDQHGVRLSHRGGVANSVVRDGRACYAHGMGAAGHHKALVEKYQTRHQQLAKAWMGYVAMCQSSMKVDRPPAHEQVYFEFGSAETDTALPSLGFLKPGLPACSLTV